MDGPKRSQSNRNLRSWGRVPLEPQLGVELGDLSAGIPATEMHSLPRGSGASYGDSCLNEGGALLLTHQHRRILHFDPVRGIIRCESGVTLGEILELIVPLGWVIPVIPGTRFVTVGGAIANDIHGKNHPAAGSFGRHVECFELLRSDGTRSICSRSENEDWYYATIAGLGLTGLIDWAELKLQRIPGAELLKTQVRFKSIQELVECFETGNWEYRVAWLDAFAFRKGRAPGTLNLARFAETVVQELPTFFSPWLRFPLQTAAPLLNRYSIRCFNQALRLKARITAGRERTVGWNSFFFPLDGLQDWNRLYGRTGFLQYQCVVPCADSLSKIFAELERAKIKPYLSVVKKMGALSSGGLLSFPRKGYTVALDFQNRSEVLKLMNRMDEAVMEAGGALYPAKDARMSPEVFAASFPKLPEFMKFLDPAMSSNFWRRVVGCKALRQL